MSDRISETAAQKEGREMVNFLNEAAEELMDAVARYWRPYHWLHPNAAIPLYDWLTSAAQQIAVHNYNLLGIPIAYPVHFAEEVLDRPAPVTINRDRPYISRTTPKED